MAIKIYIDQGHNPSGANAGAEGNGYREQDLVYEIGVRARSFSARADLTSEYQDRRRKQSSIRRMRRASRRAFRTQIPGAPTFS